MMKKLHSVGNLLLSVKGVPYPETLLDRRPFTILRSRTPARRFPSAAWTRSHGLQIDLNLGSRAKERESISPFRLPSNTTGGREAGRL